MTKSEILRRQKMDKIIEYHKNGILYKKSCKGRNYGSLILDLLKNNEIEIDKDIIQILMETMCVIHELKNCNQFNLLNPDEYTKCFLMDIFQHMGDNEFTYKIKYNRKYIVASYKLIDFLTYNYAFCINFLKCAYELKDIYELDFYKISCATFLNTQAISDFKYYWRM